MGRGERFGRGGGDRFGGRDEGAGGLRERRGGGPINGLVGLVGQTKLGGQLKAERGSGPIGKGSLNLQVANADLREHWESAQVLWIVIMSSDMGAFLFVRGCNN